LGSAWQIWRGFRGSLRGSELLLFRESLSDSLPRDATRDEMPFDAELRPFGLDILVSGFPRSVFALLRTK
jgi:hypothetical protein